MRVIFMGTPDFAVPALKALVAAGHEVVCAYTQPPRPGGRRGKELTPTPVHKAAEELSIAVRHPVSLKGADEQAAFAALQADIAVVAAYGLILPQAVLDAPRRGCINIHASLLPRWRGAAPIQRAILAGDTRTGVMLMQMEAGLDTGPILATAEVEIGSANAGELTERLARAGANLLSDYLFLAQAGTGKGMPQPVDRIEPTYAKKIDKAETRLDFSRDAIEVERQVRAFAPVPGAWFEFQGERCKVLEAELSDGNGAPGAVLDGELTIACGSGAIRPTLVQRAGRPAMTTTELLRGWSIGAGVRIA
jgi:methionyl-tRNA formyltransferase